MTDKIAYLTIDDAPTAHTRRKVDYLRERDIPAILFCPGNALEKHPDLAVYAIQNGLIVGNHSYDHPFFSQLTLEQCYEQIDRTDRIIDGLYQQAGVARPAKFFRFPFGDKGGLKESEVFQGYEGDGLERKNALQAHLRELGYSKPDFPGIQYTYYRAAELHTDVDWYWTYDTMDWAVISDDPPGDITDAAAVLARMDENEPEGGRGLNDPGSEEIVLMHDFEPTTDLFFAMIDRLLEKGLTFRPVPLG